MEEQSCPHLKYLLTFTLETLQQRNYLGLFLFKGIFQDSSLYFDSRIDESNIRILGTRIFSQ